MTAKSVVINLFSRKMVMFYLSLAAIFLLTFWGKLEGDNFMIAFSLMIGSFVVGNVGEWKYKNANIDTSISHKP